MYSILICIWGDYTAKKYKKNLNYPLGFSGHLHTRLQDVKNTKNIDLLFLGSSHAYRGFDTRIFKNAGINAFNLGSSSQTPIQSEVLLKRYLERLNPKTIIYEVDPSSFGADGIEPSLDIIANDKNDFKSIIMSLKQNHIKVYNTLIYGFYRDLFNKNSSYIEEIKKGADTYIKGGFVEKDFKYFKYMKYDKNKWKFNKKQFISFENTVNLIKDRNIKLILVQAPISSSLYNSYSNNTAFNNRMKIYGEYFNFNEILQLDDSLHFYDSHHLNQNGVILFNTKLIDILGFSLE